MENPQVNGTNEHEAQTGIIVAETNGDIPFEATNGHEPEKFQMAFAKLNEVKVTDYMRESVDKVASAEGFRNYDIKVNHGSAVGDGFVGIMLKVVIQEIDSDKKLALVLKSPPENIARRIQFGVMEFFGREVFMYNEVLPELVKFQEEKKIKKFDGFFEFPKCYFAEYNVEKNDSVIIMEDLKENGHKMWDKFIPTNYEHAKLIVSSLGRLHATSLALKAQKPELFEKFKGLNDLFSGKFLDENASPMINSNIDKALSILDEDDVETRARVMNLKNNFREIMSDVVSPENSEPYTVITHGDCWSNNFMFQYESNTLQKIVLLDWQISRYCSPVLDLLYFFFCCTDGAMRKKHYEELLNIYHRSLKNLLDHLGGDTMSQFPFTALLRQLKQNGKFGFMMAIFLIPVLTTRNEDLPEKLEEIMNAFSSKSKRYDERMRDVIYDSIRLGYF